MRDLVRVAGLLNRNLTIPAELIRRVQAGAVADARMVLWLAALIWGGSSWELISSAAALLASPQPHRQIPNRGGAGVRLGDGRAATSQPVTTTKTESSTRYGQAMTTTR
jgi:hypothetical protein